MKSLFTFLLVSTLIISLPCQGQTDRREGRHQFKYDISLPQCDFNGTLVGGGAQEVMLSGWKFKIRNIDGSGNYIIQVSEFTDNNAEADAQNLETYQDANGENIYFILTSTEYLAFAEVEKKSGRFIVGASTTLIKIRPGNGKEGEDAIFSEFGNDFNIGATAGYQISNPKNNISFSVVGGLAFSSIRVTPQTTGGFIDSESSQSAVTPSIGGILEIDKFQISAFLGLDIMSGEIGRNWIYTNRPWIGLGFGYEIFKPRGSDTNSK